ncbi:MAG: hypothetical protein E7503_05650 [Ruminococcus sp.]|nr:hypothetical protein [Ruminococcus sp.]
MKLRTFLASISACAIAVSAMAISASAAVTNANSDGAYVVAVNEIAGLAWNGGISGAVVTITPAAGWNETGVGGGVIFQGDGVDWNTGAKEFGVSGEGTDAKNVEGMTIATSGDQITLTYDFGGAIFAESATWAQLVVQSWWGADFTVDEVEYLDLDGKVIGEEAPTTTTNAAPEGGDTTTTTKAGSNATGDAGVALAVAGLAVAGAAAYVARKKD